MRTSANMKKLLTPLAVAGVAYGYCAVSRYMKEKKIARLQARKLEVWEGEGGAVPVEPTRTTAQVAPRNAPPLSPKSDAGRMR